jgi:hypothetical protein
VQRPRIISRAALESGGLEGNVTCLFRILCRSVITGVQNQDKDDDYLKTKSMVRTVCKFPSGFDAKMVGIRSRIHI